MTYDAKNDSKQTQASVKPTMPDSTSGNYDAKSSSPSEKQNAQNPSFQQTKEKSLTEKSDSHSEEHQDKKSPDANEYPTVYAKDSSDSVRQESKI